MGEDVGRGVVSTPDKTTETGVSDWLIAAGIVAALLIIAALLGIWMILGQAPRPSLLGATIVEDSGGFITLQLQDGSCVKADAGNNMRYTYTDCPPDILPLKK